MRAVSQFGTKEDDMKHYLGAASLRAGICALGISVLATPALSQSPAGTGGGAGGESGSSSAMPAQQRNPMIGAELRPRFREYVIREARPSYSYSGQVVVGAELPSAGVTYYAVPAEFGVREYRYTIVNERPVLVDPGHRIVQIIE
jgi:Protein of unknown function (DUF1236)